jgi:ribosome biogenesis GTPase A
MSMANITPDNNDSEFLNQINWRPGHMIKATSEIKNNIQVVDIIVEVRDARVPTVSGNKAIYAKPGNKPYLIVLNKANLADPEVVKSWEKWFTAQKESFIFVNALDKKSINAILNKARKIVKGSGHNKKEVSMMLLGLPNTGKSTIINKLSNRNATKAAATPGQTKLKLWVKADKDLSILDTPGVMPPVIEKKIHAMWLSVIHAIPDHIITPEYSACFIVELLLLRRSTALQDFYKLEKASNDLVEVLDQIGKRRGCLSPGGGYDYDKVYKIILGDFRKGSLGFISLEFPPKL